MQGRDVGVANLFDFARFEGDVERLGRQFRRADPLPHVVLDDCLLVEQSAIETFPAVDWPDWVTRGPYEPGKMSCQNRRVFPDPWGQLVDELNSPRALALVEAITGLRMLMPDPYLEGAGLQLSTPGGDLRMHTDFHVHTRLNIFRRLNLIVYLCPNWSAADGGHLRLQDARSGGQVTVQPAWGRCVLFESSERSVHGFAQPIAAHGARRSVAVYYYTSSEASTFSGGTRTYWRAHGEHRGMQRIRFLGYRMLLHVSRAFGGAAHLVNPARTQRS